jgi:phosphohistidine phosphatase
MKRLTLVRHAHAAVKNAHTSDFERPLSRKGTAEAEALARHLLDLKLIPQLLIASLAQRAKQTAEILARELKLISNNLKFEERLYLAPAQEILPLVRSIGPKVPHLMIVGHNPGLSDLAKLLAPQTLSGELATASACDLTFNVEAWPAVAPDTLAEARYESHPPRFFGLI